MLEKPVNGILLVLQVTMYTCGQSAGNENYMTEGYDDKNSIEAAKKEYNAQLERAKSLNVELDREKAEELFATETFAFVGKLRTFLDHIEEHRSLEKTELEMVMSRISDRPKL